MQFPQAPNQLADILVRCLIKDRHRLEREWHALKTSTPSAHSVEKRAELSDTKAPKHSDQAWSKALKWLDAATLSMQQVEANRRARPPVIEYDDALPVAAKREALVELIKQHQVVVIAGETGSGKTTQIPKMCLEAGQGIVGRIGCTQPRRLAARSVAERLAEELGSTLGDLVGYQVRFQDHVHAQSLVKVMTDGILLAEVQNDRFLSQYDTIIIDEAHERSINIDFLLGILKQLLPKRSDLKVIITSATIDTQRFADHFEMNGVRPPVVEVSGRTYPVELRYRPLVTYEDDAGNEIEQDLPTAIVDALDELSREDPFGDVLVFQVGERDIKETAEVLRKHQLKNTEIVPLYARLSLAEQNKVFQTSQKRRVILSTNVAETSLTVPGIKYVIDPGWVRISRYSVRSKVQRLPVEKISQASANQRKGRCGRVSEGICIRLYAEEDFNARPEFTDPEIHRTSLASIILTMAQLKLGEVKRFPFIEAPSDKSINDGFRQLHELGALDDKRRLTNEGRQLAKLPVDPSIAKMILQGQKNAVLAEVLVIAAALSIQDPREINETNQQAARQAHKAFEDERSDFLFFLNLWHFYEHQRRHLSQGKLRKLCKTNFLNYMRMKEWHELYTQLELSLKRSGIKVPALHLFEEVRNPKSPKEVQERLSDLHSMNVHRSLLAGLLGNISMREDDKSYLGARNTKLFIHPGSSLFKHKPKWMLSAELVETSKLYARNNAAIDIRWVEPLAKHLIKHSYQDPHWQRKSGQVGAFESVTLFGLPIVSRRRCNYGPINPEESRKIFIRHALVEGQLNTRAAFYQHNQRLIAGIEKLESKLRRPDYLVDDEVLYRFYDERLPAQVFNQPALESWLKKLKPEEEKALYLSEAQLMKQAVEVDLKHDFPDQVRLQNQLPLKVDYRFEPGQPRDGVVFKLPLHTLNRLQPAAFEWLTPGFLKEKIVFYIKALPKQLRKQFVPAPAIAEKALQWMEAQSPDHSADFTTLLVQALNRHAVQKISAGDFGASSGQTRGDIGLPDYLRPYFILLDDKQHKIAESADLNELKAQYQHLVDELVDQKLVQQGNQPPAQDGSLARRLIQQWDFGDLAEKQSIKNRHHQLEVYPCLAQEGDEIYLTVAADPQQAQQQHREAVWTLLQRTLQDKVKYLHKQLPMQKACLIYAPYGTCESLKTQVIERALKQLIPEPEAIRSQLVFEHALELLRAEWVNHAQKLAKLVNEILSAHQKIAKLVNGRVNPRWLASIGDIKTQLAELICSGFVADTPDPWLAQLPRYLQALEKRLEKIDQDPAKDQVAIRQLQPLLDQFQVLAQNPAYVDHPGLLEIRWLIEELRISLFAQPLKTLQPVSIQRLQKQLKDL
jgi:ATP-dependent helicase HrpA